MAFNRKINASHLGQLRSMASDSDPDAIRGDTPAREVTIQPPSVWNVVMPVHSQF